MTEVLKWAGIVGAVWLSVSILVAVGWALIGRRIFRKPPTPAGVSVESRGDRGVIVTRDGLGSEVYVVDQHGGV